jgi:hypothetical protein
MLWRSNTAAAGLVRDSETTHDRAGDPSVAVARPSRCVVHDDAWCPDGLPAAHGAASSQAAGRRARRTLPFLSWVASR